MMKRILALLLCFLMLVPCLAACSSKDDEDEQEEEVEEDKGAEINIYLSEMVFDLDPASAYNNEAALKVISLLYEPLFYLDENGKIKSNLVEKYEIEENEEAQEYKMFLHLADTYWSDSTYVSANDVVYSWKRVLDVENSYACACLLFDIKNARKAREGDLSIDNIGLSAPGDRLVEITFEKKINYDQFILNLTSYALAPLRENIASKTSYIDGTTGGQIVRKTNDWAKKAATVAASGPFKLRTVVYPDDPIKNADGTYMLDANGNYVYPRYGTSVVDGAMIKLSTGTKYEVNANGETIVYPADYLQQLKDEDPTKYAELRGSLLTVEGTLEDFVSTPQNEPKLILERNTYYFKDKSADPEEWKIDTIVKPYRLNIDYSLSDAEILEKYNAGEIFYVGDIPLSLRTDYKSKVTLTDALSTHTYYMNEEAVIPYTYVSYDEKGLPILFDKAGKQYLFNSKCIPLYVNPETKKAITYEEEVDENGNIVYFTAENVAVYSTETKEPILGEKLFANKSFRQALSLAIDRESIANAVVFAQAASALVPTGVFQTNSAKKTFRENGGKYLATTADLSAAGAKITESGINLANFKIHLSFAAYDEVHTMVATTVAEAWRALGVQVELQPLMYFDNTDYWTTTEELHAGVKDDLWLETLVSGNYEVMAMDMVSYSVDAFGVLAPFATLFSGMGMDMKNFNEKGEQQYIPANHITGFCDETYNAMIEEIFAEEDLDKRAELLHKAEEYLMEQMPVIPIFYNQNATMCNDSMLTAQKGNYYSPAGFTKSYLKGTTQYITHVTEIRNTIIIVSSVSVVVIAAVTLIVIRRIKEKKREEEIARISAEHEAKLREIRPGAKRA